MSEQHDLVTIALHCGKQDYYPLVENYLKSLLICVEYPNIEVMLVETGGNKDIRDWFERLDFSKNFVNFDGTETNVTKHPGTKMQKSLVFLDPDPDDIWYMCYVKGMKAAIKHGKGKYFVLSAEDNQFNVKGDVISDYIGLLESPGNEKSFVHFFSQQAYKYKKRNNSFTGPHQNNGFDYYEVKQERLTSKWCPFGLTNIEHYTTLGEITVPKHDDHPHIPWEEYAEKVYQMGYKRFYPQLSHGVWMYNNDRTEYINKIKTNTKNNPNYVLYGIGMYDELKKVKSSLPFSTDNFVLSGEKE